MKISEQQTLQFGEESSISLPVDSHANHTAQQESERARKMIATSGRKCLEQFEKFNRTTLWAKTFAGLLIGMGGWYSTRCKLTWKLKATKCSRFYFQLQVSELRIEGTGYGLLPTPTVVQSPYQYSNGDKKRPKTLTLVGKARAGLLPTPTSSVGQQWGCTRKEEKRQNWNLSDLAHGLYGEAGKSSQLNPLFVEEMMGYPKDWTVSPFENGKKKV